MYSVRHRETPRARPRLTLTLALRVSVRWHVSWGSTEGWVARDARAVRDVVIFHAGTLRVPAVNKVPLGSGGARAARHASAVQDVRVLVADWRSVSPDVSTFDNSSELGAVT